MRSITAERNEACVDFASCVCRVSDGCAGLASALRCVVCVPLVLIYVDYTSKFCNDGNIKNAKSTPVGETKNEDGGADCVTTAPTNRCKPTQQPLRQTKHKPDARL